jgi:hypothetical protein
MQQSSTTSFLGDVLKGDDPCFITLNEIFQTYANQSGDAWEVEGKNLNRPVTQLDPKELADFLVTVATRRCIEQQALSQSLATCNGRCIAGFKEFQEHLTFDQHEWIWKHTPNMTVVVLERDVEARWKLKWVADETGDWNVKGDAEDKKKIESMIIPSVATAFRKIHEDWYRFIRFHPEDDTGNRSC